MEGEPIRWPPPGLERMQGDLTVIGARAALAGLLLVLPVVFVVTRIDDAMAFGPFADAWWVLIGLGVVGLGLGLDVFGRLARTVFRSRAVLGRGYAPVVVLSVLVDRTHDMGFLMSGARHFSTIESRERDGIAMLRVVAWVMITSAGLWLLVSLSGALFAASRGALGPRALPAVVLLPGSVLYVFAGVALLLQDERVRRARRRWFSQPWSEDLASEEVGRWHRSVGAEPRPASGSGLRAAGWAVIVLAGIFAVPVLTLMPASAVGPILTAVAVPGSDRVGPRAMRTEAFRSYRVDGDVDIAADEAGRLLHRLMYVGVSDPPPAGQQEPDQRIAEPWFPPDDGGSNPTGLGVYLWPDSLFERAEAGLPQTGRDWLAGLVDHPGHEDLGRLARATAIDVGAARWTLPFPPGTTISTIPMPRFGTFRDGAHAHIGAAVGAWLDGRPDDAERMLREVVSVGFLLADDGPTLIDNLIGHTLIEAGGKALGDFYRVSGQAAAAAELSRLREVADRNAALAGTDNPLGGDAWVRALYAMTTDSALPRGLRWEYFINISTIAPCLNLNRIVFGPGAEHDAFVEDARTALVRWPSEQALFDVARHGWIGQADPVGETALTRALGFFMNSGPNSCRRLMSYMQVSGGI